MIFFVYALFFALIIANVESESQYEGPNRNLMSGRGLSTTPKFLVFKESGYCDGDENYIHVWDLCKTAAATVTMPQAIKNSLDTKEVTVTDSNYVASGCIGENSYLATRVILNIPDNGDKGLNSAECGDQSGDCICTQDCPDGMYGMYDKEFCQYCQLGRFGQAATVHFPSCGSVPCIECGINTYQDEEGQGNCKVCELGRVTRGRSGVNNSLLCEACPRGKYRESGDDDCKFCPTGKMTLNEASSSIEDCGEHCLPGMYRKDVNGECLLCPPGKYVTQGNASMCDMCPGGKHIPPKNTNDTYERHDEETDCKFCPLGTEFDSIDTACLVCEAGKYQDESTAPKISGTDNFVNISCKACPQNTFISDDRLHAIVHGDLSDCLECPDGKFTESGRYCNDCPAGFRVERNSGEYQKHCSICEAGRYSVDIGARNCSVCGSGFYQPENGSTFCLPCIPGKFQSSIASRNCTLCDVGKYASQDKQIQCKECLPGYFSTESGAATCNKCRAGTYGDGCKTCMIGKFRSYADPVLDCKPCGSGRFAAEGSATCTVIPPGSYLNATNVTLQCEAGFKCEGGTSGRVMCPPGFYAGSPGSVACIACSPGRVSTGSGSIKCLECKENTYAKGSNQTACTLCETGHFAEKGSATCTGIPPGSYLNATNVTLQCEAGFKCEGGASHRNACPPGKSARNQGSIQCFECSPGKYADSEATANCKSCPSGFSQGEEGKAICTKCDRGSFSFSGASACTRCDLGKYELHSSCVECPSGLYSDARGSTTCLNCTNGKISNTQATACEKPAWKVKEDCKLGEYLNDKSKNKSHHSCESCMFGADCSRLTAFTSLQPKRGYKAMSWNQSMFGACLLPEACNGTCMHGHAGELCAQCLPGWATTSKYRILCTPCPEVGMTVLLFAGAMVVATFVFCYLVWDNLEGASLMASNGASARMPFHCIAIRIVSSYLQIAGLLTRFDLTLPKAVHTLAIIESSSSSLSEQLLLFDCATEVREELFLLRQITSVWLLPLISSLCCAVFWALKCHRKIHQCDGFIASQMILFYTLFPSVMNRIALVFSCKTYGDRNLLSESPSVQCLSTAHWTMVFSIGLPGILIYMFIIPISIARTLIIQRKKATLYPSQLKYNSRWTMRMGFMFAGYRKGYEWWETVVMLRKCAFVLLSVFLRTYGTSPQVVAASMVLSAALSVHLQHRPYMDAAHNRLESIGLHVCLVQLLVTLMSNMTGRVENRTTHSSLGLQSTIIVITVVFASTGYFIWEVITLTLQKSQGSEGVVGCVARRCKFCARKHVKVAPKKNKMKLAMRALEKYKRETQVTTIQKSSHQHREAIMLKIDQSKAYHYKRLQARLTLRSEENKKKIRKCDS